MHIFFFQVQNVILTRSTSLDLKHHSIDECRISLLRQAGTSISHGLELLQHLTRGSAVLFRLLHHCNHHSLTFGENHIGYSRSCLSVGNIYFSSIETYPSFITLPLLWLHLRSLSLLPILLARAQRHAYLAKDVRNSWSLGFERT